MSSTKKSRKECVIGDGDHISYLPDDIVSRILSSIPTVDAVATCVWSRYWQYKWTCIYNIEVDDRKRYQLGASGEAMFIKFLNNIVDRTENVRRIRLKLMYKYDRRVVYSWMSALLKNKLEILYIDTRQDDLVIPGSLLSTSLSALVFGTGVFKVSDSNCFRNLRNLFLEKVEIRNGNSGSDTLSFSFPVLEVLKLLKCTWSHVKFVEICAPSMNTFMSETKLKATGDDYKINILGGKITNFTAKGGEPENLSVVGSKVTYAALQNIIAENDRAMEKSGVKVRNLLKQFSSALEELTLSLYVAQALMLPEELFYLPRFDKLQRLVLCSSEHFTYGTTDALLEFLMATPFLKYLVIDVLRWEEYDYDTVEPIPPCITSSLEEIELRNITAIETAFQLAKFLLKTAVNLKKFNVTSLYEKVKVEVAKDIASAYPDISICVTIVGH